jgi:hypothetical protein
MKLFPFLTLILSLSVPRIVLATEIPSLEKGNKPTGNLIADCRSRKVTNGNFNRGSMGSTCSRTIHRDNVPYHPRNVNVNPGNINGRNVNREPIHRNNVKVHENINRNQIHRPINVYGRPHHNYHRNVVVNPVNHRGWGWNRGVVWTPNYSYWGGGFWGGFLLGVITGTIANNQYNYMTIERGSPGDILFNDYSLVQTSCNDNAIVINGPSNSVICAQPNSVIPPGTYMVDPSTLTLIPQ